MRSEKKRGETTNDTRQRFGAEVAFYLDEFRRDSESFLETLGSNYGETFSPETNPCDAALDARSRELGFRDAGHAHAVEIEGEPVQQTQSRSEIADGSVGVVARTYGRLAAFYVLKCDARRTARELRAFNHFLADLDDDEREVAREEYQAAHAAFLNRGGF